MKQLICVGGSVCGVFGGQVIKMRHLQDEKHAVTCRSYLSYLVNKSFTQDSITASNVPANPLLGYHQTTSLKGYYLVRMKTQCV
jgi:hypothetical protein